MAQCFQESHDAYARGDGAGAKDLSNQGKDHQRKMEQLNKQASDWIYFGPFLHSFLATRSFSSQFRSVNTENNKVCSLVST